jgi:hypothetical protein
MKPSQHNKGNAEWWRVCSAMTRDSIRVSVPRAFLSMLILFFHHVSDAMAGDDRPDHGLAKMRQGREHYRLTVNTLEAVYGRESSFGTLLGIRGSSKAAGHFQFEPDTASRYGLSVSKKNDQRFDIDRASSAAARYLKYHHRSQECIGTEEVRPRRLQRRRRSCGRRPAARRAGREELPVME